MELGKVCIVSPYYYPAVQFGGPVASVGGLARALQNSGVELSVVTSNLGIAHEISPGTETCVDGVNVAYLDYRNTTYSALFGAQNSLERTVARHLAGRSLVYISGVWEPLSIAAANYCRKNSVPYIVALRGALTREAFRDKVWKKLPFYLFCVRRNLEGASAVHVTTESEFRRSRSLIPRGVPEIRLPNGVVEPLEVDDATVQCYRQKYELPPSAMVVSFLGRIHHIKRIEYIITEFSGIAQVFENLFLLLAGPCDARYRKKLDSLVLEKRVGDRVRFVGVVRGEERAAVYLLSNAFVLPSVTENFGNVVVEAMSYGVPVVVTESVGVAEFLVAYGCGKVITAESGLLASALMSILAGVGDSPRLAQRGSELVARFFSWHAIGCRMKAEMETILNR